VIHQDVGGRREAKQDEIRFGGPTAEAVMGFPNEKEWCLDCGGRHFAWLHFCPVEGARGDWDRPEREAEEERSEGAVHQGVRWVDFYEGLVEDVVRGRNCGRSRVVQDVEVPDFFRL